MIRSVFAASILLLITAAVAMAQAPYVGANEADNEFANITAADMDIIRTKKVLFASRSWGLNTGNGLTSLANQNPMYRLNRIWGINVMYGEDIPVDVYETYDVVNFLATYWPWTARVDELDNYIRTRYHDDIDAAIIFYHLAAPSLYDYYTQKMDALRRDFPHIKFIYVTSGVSTLADDPSNPPSCQFGQMILDNYRGVVPIYDIKDIVSTHADGTSAGCRMCPEFNTSGDNIHPNLMFAQERLGKAFLLMLYKLFCAPGLTANAGADQEVVDTDQNGYEAVTLDGSSSYDSENTIVSWVWREGTTIIATGETASVNLAVGVHHITLTVTNNATPDPMSEADPVIVTVSEQTPLTAYAGPDQTVIDMDDNGSQAVTLNASGSLEPGGPIVSWVWSEAGQQIATGETVQVTLGIGVHVITLTATNGVSNTDTDTVAITVMEPDVRVRDGLQALYTFEEGSGAAVHDVSNVGTPLDLVVADTGAVTWGSGILAVNSATMIASPGAATKLVDACQPTGSMSIEAWIKPANVTQDGPACIVTMSADHDNRNFTLGQGLTSPEPPALYNCRFRASGTSNNGEPSITTADGTATIDLTHVVYTRSAAGPAKIYINGIERASGEVEGVLAVWDDTYRLALGNELIGGRPWLGEYHLVALYNRVLTTDEITRNYQVGTNPAPAAAPQVVGWQTVADHGPLGEIATVLDDNAIESRGSGLRKIVVTLSQPIVPSTLTAGAVTLTGQISGNVSSLINGLSLNATGTILTITLSSAAPNADVLTLTLTTTLTDYYGQPIVGDRNVNIRTLAGDVDASGAVTAADVLAVRSQAGKALASGLLRYDVDGSGTLTAADMRAVRACLGTSLP
ncbi:MAG: hypothetical protein JXL80_02305 [Planctomycetes bacterium]|nr:hypothetical protein [Planctomycetota bacterium]